MNELHYQLDLLKAMNQKLTERERMYTRVCESAEGAFLYCSFAHRTIFALGRWKDYFDFEIRQSKDFARILEEVEEPYVLSLREVLFLEKLGEESAAAECRLKGRDSWLRFGAKVFYDRDGAPVDKVISIRDITEARGKSEELTYMAHYDSLTGLYNRSRFLQLLEGYVGNAAEANNLVSVMMIDIDGFRKVKESVGAVAGDGLLRQFGDFLRGLCGRNVTACRLHGDVFGMAVCGPSGRESVDALYSAILQRTKEPFENEEGRDIRITVSVGAAEYPEAAASAQELLDRAEAAVFCCKFRDGGMLQYFDASILSEYRSCAEMENRLREAVFCGEFFLCYQPQYYAGNRRLRGMEALVRWRGRDGRLISPAEFIPVAEKSGVIQAIGNWVLEESVRQYAKWRRQFGFPMILSVNVSAVQYRQESFAELLADVLGRYKVKPSEIELEIREELWAENMEAVIESLKNLKKYGVRISLDDFGSGVSSLSLLRKLPIDTLKLDKSLLDTVLADSAARAVTESVVSMTKALGIDIVAEGVEEEQLYRYLHSVGCHVIQGYLFGRPLSAEEFEEMLSDITGQKGR